jgi:maltose O-acetyltransferase
MIDFILSQAAKIRRLIDEKRESRRWKKLQDMGLHLGKDILLPMSTWIDTSHCFLISIGDRCRFGPNCVILAHDATMNEFLDAGRIGRVIIHESCSFGFGTVILPGVEIGPRVIAGAHSIISSNIPPDSVVSGNPAKVVAKLDDYLKYHRLMMRKVPLFPYKEYGMPPLPLLKRLEMLTKLDKTFGYITGGYTYTGKTEKVSPDTNESRAID